MRHVLVPLDGSSLGESALNQAADVLIPGGRLTLVTAVEMPDIPMYGFDLVGVSSAPSYQASLEDLVKRARGYLDKVAEVMRGRGFDVHALVQFGEPATVIIDMACQLQVDTIIMSTHGRSGIGRWLFGSVTSKVLTQSPCPVLVVPSERRMPAYRCLSDDLEKSQD